MTAPVLSQQQMTSAYAAQAAAVRAQAAAFVAAQWAQIPFMSAANADAFVQSVVPVVRAAQQTTGHLTAAYLQDVLAAMGETPYRAGVPDRVMAGAAPRNGTDPGEVYRRPAIQVWSDVQHGKDPDLALKAGAERAQSLVATDMQLAKTHTAQHVLAEQPRISGYRRVLTGPHSCGLCIVAVTQRYHKADLMPIHPGCDCGIAPIIGDKDPGQVIDDTMLAGAHAAIRERFGRHNLGAREISGTSKDNGTPVMYRDVLITHQHGEIGPILAVRGQKFTSAADIAALR